MRKLLLATLIFFAASSFAQISDLTLTVIGTGETEEKATQNALRNALEQAYGAFVISRTSIIMDELERDDIAVHANGQIKDIKYNAISTLPNGQISVSVTATVSMQKLIGYAQGKGSEVAFMGNEYVAKLKMMQLKVDNATKTLAILTKQLEDLSKSLFSFNLSMSSSPVLQDGDYKFDAILTVYSNQASHQFFNSLVNTLLALKLQRDEVKFFLDNQLPIGALNGNYFQMSCLQIKPFVGYPTRDANGREIIEYDRYRYAQLPIADDTLAYYGKRISNCFLKSVNRVVIQELGNNKHHNIYAELSNELRINERFKMLEFHLPTRVSHTKDEIKLAKKNKQTLAWIVDSVVPMEVPIINIIIPLYISATSMNNFKGFKLSGRQVFTPTNVIEGDNPQFESILKNLLEPTFSYSSEAMDIYDKNPFGFERTYSLVEDWKIFQPIEGTQSWYKRKRDDKLFYYSNSLYNSSMLKPNFPQIVAADIDELYEVNDAELRTIK